MPESVFQHAPQWARELGVGHVGEYFGPWAMEPKHLQAVVERVQQINLQLHVAELRDEPPRVSGGGRNYELADGRVAVIDLRGPLMKQASSLSGGSSTVLARRRIREAAADDEVASILLRIDSPGGTVAGAADLGDEIARAAAVKPLDAYIDDMGASGAYWAASQARRIYANRTALVGSIGTYAVLVDASGQAAQRGVKVHVVRAGDFKGAGYPGTEIEAPLLAEQQALVDALNEQFVRAVSGGRKFTLARTRELADGRLHVGAAALEAGLIDGLESFDETLSRLQTRSRSPSRTRTSRSAAKMSADDLAGEAREANSEPRAAAYRELKAALPGADAEFICRQMEANSTVAQAQAAWMAELTRRNDAVAAERDAAAKERDEARARIARNGVDPLSARRRKPDDDEEDDDDEDDEEKSRAQEGPATAEFQALVAKETQRLSAQSPHPRKNQLPPSARAVMNVVRRRPDLQRAMILEANGGDFNGLAEPTVLRPDPLGLIAKAKRLAANS